MTGLYAVELPSPVAEKAAEKVLRDGRLVDVAALDGFLQRRQNVLAGVCLSEDPGRGVCLALFRADVMCYL
jgi:hypothetical protein